MDLSYRGLTLATWELKGASETWRGQLDAYYKKEPVFAILGGIVSGSWAPVHTFCEQNRIPCIFPVTDQPVISDSDWYTLYFSKGPYQEGEAAAKFLKEKDGPVVQVYRRNDEGNLLSEGFRR
jgi:ABC-type branched-subunit amino acid transport system substrate-binding protein